MRSQENAVLCGEEHSCRLKRLFRPLEFLPPAHRRLSQLTFNLFSLQRRSTGPRSNILSFKIFLKEAIVYYITQTFKQPLKSPGSVLTVLAWMHILEDLNLTWNDPNHSPWWLFVPKVGLWAKHLFGSHAYCKTALNWSRLVWKLTQVCCLWWFLLMFCGKTSSCGSAQW